RVCGAIDATIEQLEPDGLKVVAHYGPISAPVGLMVPLISGTVGGRAVLERRAVHVEDVHAAADEFPHASAYGREYGHRAILGVPLLREGVALGVILLRREQAHAVTDKQIALLQTFADQAVIAIENVRLFTELQTSNRELTTALVKRTATSDILQVFSRSQTGVH